MISLTSPARSQAKLAAHVRARRLDLGLTQQGLASRADVSLATLRKFERQGVISLESFLKLLMALGCLDAVVDAVEPDPVEFMTIDDVLKGKKKAKRGWRK